MLEHLAQAVRLLDRGRQAPGRVDGDLRVVADHVHAQLDRGVGDQAADLAQPDHAEGVPGQLVAGEGLLARLDPCLQLRVVRRRARRRSAAQPSRLRAASSMPASTSSLTALALAPGALNTGTPRADIAATGMLLVPEPARPMASTDSRDRSSVQVGRPHQDGVRVGDVGRDREPVPGQPLRARGRRCG